MNEYMHKRGRQGIYKTPNVKACRASEIIFGNHLRVLSS